MQVNEGKIFQMGDNKLNTQGFSDKGNWYKGNLHSHTTNSDGKWTPEEAIKNFKSKGYSFLCLSEHDIYTDYRNVYDREDFILLPGVEASAVLFNSRNDWKPLKVHHIHGILGTEAMQKGAVKSLEHMEALKPPVFFESWEGAEVAAALSEKLKSMGFFTAYNHPVWSRVEESEVVNTEGLWAIEIYNYNTVNECNLGYDTLYWDQMLRKGKRVFATATDDNHNGGKFPDAFGGWIMVKSEILDHESIVSNMLKGNYYSSSGPEIFDFGVRMTAGGDNREVYIKCSSVSHINFIVGNCVGDGATLWPPIEATLTEAIYPLKGHETYVRVECVDKAGRMAWTNPIFF